MDLVLVKVVITTLAFILGVLNLLVMLEMMEKIRLFGLSYETLSRWHRRQGDVILVLFFTAAPMIFASLVLLLVLSKVLIVNVKVFKRGYRIIDYIGASLFTSLLVVFG